MPPRALLHPTRSYKVGLPQWEVTQLIASGYLKFQALPLQLLPRLAFEATVPFFWQWCLLTDSWALIPGGPLGPSLADPCLAGRLPPSLRGHSATSPTSKGISWTTHELYWSQATPDSLRICWKSTQSFSREAVCKGMLIFTKVIRNLPFVEDLEWDHASLSCKGSLQSSNSD